MNDDNARDHQGNAVSLPEEARQQVVSYLEHQAGKSLADLLLLVDRAASLTEQSLLDISDAQASFRPSEGEWSVVEIISHVSASLRGTARLVEGLGRGTESSSVSDALAFGVAGAMTPAEMRADVAAAYERSPLGRPHSRRWRRSGENGPPPLLRRSQLEGMGGFRLRACPRPRRPGREGEVGAGLSVIEHAGRYPLSQGVQRHGAASSCSNWIELLSPDRCRHVRQPVHLILHRAACGQA